MASKPSSLGSSLLVPCVQELAKDPFELHFLFSVGKPLCKLFVVRQNEDTTSGFLQPPR